MIDQEFSQVVAIVEAFCKILAVLIPKVQQGTANPKEQEAYGQAVAGLSAYRDQMAGAIVEKWDRYGYLTQIPARIPGGGPAIIPVLESLRDLARFQILNNPAGRPIWEPRLQQIEWDMRRFQQ